MNESKKIPVKVFFVKTDDGTIDAVMPFELDTYNPETMVVYSHVGGHSGCHSGWVREQKTAKAEEYKSLLDELTRIGYDVEILKRFPNSTSYNCRVKTIKKYRQADRN